MKLTGKSQIIEDRTFFPERKYYEQRKPYQRIYDLCQGPAKSYDIVVLAILFGRDYYICLYW